MLTICVFVGRTEIARATAGNVSNLADISDYVCRSTTSPFPDRSKPVDTHEFPIKCHNRNQSVWALIRTMADNILRLDQEKRDDERA